MKDKASAALVFPSPAEEEGEAPDDETEESPSDKDTLLGNAYDAMADGDRAGFIASMKALLASR